jgi:gamma-glutamyltranspeptidase/glutathione hydrolase
MRTAIAAALLTIATPLFAGSQVTAAHAALSTSSPLATKAGLGILERGGNAVDAAIAVALVLGVVQPQSGGIGGGGFLVYFDAKSGAVWTLDFREVSPIEAKGDTKLHAATPGLLAGLEAMHKKLGTRPWRELVEPSIVASREATKSELTATLTRIAELGARVFYDGAMVEPFIAAVKNGGGTIGHRDLHDYAPVWRAPIRLRFGDYDIFAPAPPSTGGLLIGEALEMISGLDLAASGFQSVKSLHLLAEVERRASMDSAKYAGDPRNARIPYRDLLSAERAAAWRSSIKADKPTPTIALAEPGSSAPAPLVPPIAGERFSSAFVVTDASGNVAAMSTSCGGEFVVPGLGFVLNDAMNDFGGSTETNAFDSGKRPATSLTPAIVLKNGRPYLALGSAGGATVPTTVLQVLVNALLYKKPLYDAVAAARVHQQANPDQIEYERTLAQKAAIDALNAMGHGVAARDSIGDVQALMFERGKILAVADPRHGGAAGGY